MHEGFAFQALPVLWEAAKWRGVSGMCGKKILVLAVNASPQANSAAGVELLRLVLL